MGDAITVHELVGEVVRLEPLSLAHVDELVSAATEDSSAYAWTVVPSNHQAMTTYVNELLADFERGLVVPFAQISVVTGRAVGATRYLNIRRRANHPVPYAVEIGGTWLASSAQRTAVNTEAKFLLMTYAFEQWGVVRVDLKTDARNERSRNAMARIGGTFEGVLRQWQPSQVVGEEDLFRDSAMFSVIAAQWPGVRDVLQARLM
ncbi:MAG: GNAT family protein [Acidimicrobiales bacterium]|jgi:RimJ/RimL family protein N-acetyltransferase